MYAIIEAGGKQFRVQEGNKLVVDRMDVEAGQEVTFDRVIMIGGRIHENRRTSGGRRKRCRQGDRTFPRRKDSRFQEASSQGFHAHAGPSPGLYGADRYGRQRLSGGRSRFGASSSSCGEQPGKQHLRQAAGNLKEFHHGS